MLKSVRLIDLRIPIAKEAKYLGVIFDQKLTWNVHIQKAINKASMVISRCRKRHKRNWVLNPKMTQKFIYTSVIWHSITYGSVVLWPKTRVIRRHLGALYYYTKASMLMRHEKHSNIGNGSVIEPDTTIYKYICTITKRSKVCTQRLYRIKQPLHNFMGEYTRSCWLLINILRRVDKYLRK